MSSTICCCDHAGAFDVCEMCRHAHPHQAGYIPLRYCRDWGVCVIDRGRRAVAVRCVRVTADVVAEAIEVEVTG